MAIGLISIQLALVGGAARAEAVQVLALGDSLTAGYGLREEFGFVPQLQDWLRTRGHEVEVINAGVSGDTTAGGLARLDWSLSDDVDAMIVTLGGNDLLRGIDPASSRANLDAILTRAGERGVEVLLVGLAASGNFGPEFKRDFDAMYPDLADKHGALLARNFFDGIAPEGGSVGDMNALMQADGIHPNAQGVSLIVEALGPSVEALIARVTEP